MNSKMIMRFGNKLLAGLFACAFFVPFLAQAEINYPRMHYYCVLDSTGNGIHAVKSGTIRLFERPPTPGGQVELWGINSIPFSHPVLTSPYLLLQARILRDEKLPRSKFRLVETSLTLSEDMAPGTGLRSVFYARFIPRYSNTATYSDGDSFSVEGGGYGTVDEITGDWFGSCTVQIHP